MPVCFLVKYKHQAFQAFHSTEQSTPCSVIFTFMREKAAEMWFIIVLLAGVNCSCVSYP